MRTICSGSAGTLAFENPLEVVSADNAAGVLASFERIEAALDDGKYVAGFLSYELGAVLVPKQRTLVAAPLPLLSIGVYEAPATPDEARGDFSVGPLAPGVSTTGYRAAIATILAAIREGEVYQVNYAVPFHFGFRGDPYGFYGRLTQDRAFPHAAYVETDEFALVSCSPELFLSFEGARIVAKPMKGTARHTEPAALGDEKNRAEHVMIVDLLRNDLHRLSDRVEVERLFEVERYPAFVTMTSTIAAELEQARSFGEILNATFPSGSVTGAPKAAAMQWIARVEREPRGIFCGSIGYLGPSRTGSWNVAIRTAAIDKRTGRGVLNVGGGIVADSDADAEWREIETKRRFFDAVTPRYALIETLALADGLYRRLAGHLARLERSADALHFAYDADRVLAALELERPHHNGLVRLALEPDGTVKTGRRALRSSLEPVALCWASEILDSSEPLLRHKTSWRPLHDAALANAQRNGCFDALLCNERGDIADGSRSTLFVRDGTTLLTPPLSAGALPGVLRASLLATGDAREARITPNDVARATEIFVGNSARGMLRAFVISSNGDSQANAARDLPASAW
jgi:para-aminobenzoate synthetase/4-amino-4-deoxychorismate lyase